MKVVVDRTKCTGHARCFEADEELFPLDDLGYALRSEFDVPPGAEATAREGAAMCPERAITLREESP
ncbi:ferredoxin [Cryptosporangium sp. NPDC048952]|uniref:ferredoxin n=1 Tax=Cryptosporangium sp. NPDC048952 TaxID=3363961 RepID=UPI003722E0A6